MHNRFILVILLFSTILFAGCIEENEISFVSKWQSLNDASSVMEFTQDNKIILFRNSESFWAQVSKCGELNYTISKQSEGWYKFLAFDGDDLFFKGKIEIVNKDRIRIYYYKHHDILDLADEYHRTLDFKSFDKIMKEIIDEPEE